jgi:hypothetical protein
MTPEELAARKEKQNIRIEMLRTDEAVQELPLKPEDHATCVRHGYKYGAVAKFLDTRDDMLSLFCVLTP